MLRRAARPVSKQEGSILRDGRVPRPPQDEAVGRALGFRDFR